MRSECWMLRSELAWNHSLLGASLDAFAFKRVRRKPALMTRSGRKIKEERGEEKSVLASRCSPENARKNDNTKALQHVLQSPL